MGGLRYGSVVCTPLRGHNCDFEDFNKVSYTYRASPHDLGHQIGRGCAGTGYD